MPGSQNVVIYGRDANGDAVPVLADSAGALVVPAAAAVNAEVTTTATLEAPTNAARKVIQPTDTGGGAFTITMAAAGWQGGDEVIVTDSPGTSWAGANLTIDFGTHNYHEAATQTAVLSGGSTRRFLYVNAAIGFIEGGIL